MKISEAFRDFIDELTGGQKLLVGVVAFALLSGVLFGGYAWSGYRIKRLEKETAEAKTRADRFEAIAAKKEMEAARYAEKIEHLEGRLVEIREIAKTQDEELKKIDVSVVDARGRADRARRVRTIATTADELCKRLAEVEHPCDE